MSVHRKNENLIPTIKEGSFALSKEEIIETIINVLRDNFEVTEGFENNYKIPIHWNCEDFDASVLEEKLMKVNGFENLININSCDSIQDIINNNFKF